MSLFRKIFGKKMDAANTPDKVSKTADDPANDPNMIRVYDGYGREMFITKQKWKEDILFDTLEKARNDPDQLYNILVGALQDGFASDVVSYAEHLHRTDPIQSRAANMLGIVYMDMKRLDDAEEVLKDFLSSHAEDGYVLTNLAKVYDRRGNNAKAESILWHALEIDPNQDNGLGWYTSIHRDRGGEASALDAFRRVAVMQGSWRAQLWLARDAIQSKDLAAAESLYIEALTRVDRPVPTELLMQMSGDLGNGGYLSDVVRLVEPHFDQAFHGIQVGNNLIKAYYDLGQLDAAQSILNRLYAQKRPDWQQTLRHWDTEIAKAGVTNRAKVIPDQLSLSLMSIEGPLWSRDGSPFVKLLPEKRSNAQHVAILGSMVLLPQSSERPALQLSDNPGRLSRATPLFLAEKIHLGTDVIAFCLIPWVQDQGFAVLGHPYDDQALCALTGKSEKKLEFIVGVTLNASGSSWKLSLSIVRISDGRRIGEAEVEVSPANPGPAVEQLAEKLVTLLTKYAGVQRIKAPTWYQIPTGQDFSDYLLRLEQQLAVASMNLDFLKGGGLSGEHEILDGILQLCVKHPGNQIIRMLFARTIYHMKKVKPTILNEYKEKIQLLQHNHPLQDDNVSQLIIATIAEAL